MEIESDFRHPALRVTPASLEAHFRGESGRSLRPLRNFHREPEVDSDARRSAKPAAVLIPIVVHPSGLRLLLTRRHHSISFPGHVCFPGGHCDAGDASREATALREAREEIGLAAESVTVLGRLGDYVSHSGHRIAPVVGLVGLPLDLTPHPGEVEEVLEIPLDRIFDARSYRLRSSGPASTRAHFYLTSDDAVVAGITVSILMGFYEELLESHTAE